MAKVVQLRPNSLFKDIDSVLAAQLYVEKGVTLESAKRLDITPGLFTAWANSPDGQGAVRGLQRQLNSKLEARLSYILEEAAERIVTCFREGDEHVLKTGEIVKVAVPAVHAARIFDTLFRGRQLLRNQPTAITDVDAKINDLAEKLAAIGKAAQIQPTPDPEYLTIN